MPLSPDLFDSLNPPTVWVTLAAPDSGESPTRLLTVRICETGKRSISATADIDRYSPEPSIFTAVAKMIERIQACQVPMTRTLLSEELSMAVLRWVEPF
jgi:hypothetical protein